MSIVNGQLKRRRYGHTPGPFGEADVLARALAYRLYTICERKNRAKEALDHNSLVIVWPEISKLANEPHRQEQQKSLFK